MSNLAVIDRPDLPSTSTVTVEQVDLVKRTVASGATPDELKLYLYDCQRQGVHPLDRLLHFTKRGGRYTPVTSIDLMRTRAADTNEYAGSDDAVFVAGGDGAAPAAVASATVTVYRLVQGTRCGFTATARWAEYFPGEQSGAMWKKMPHTMLAKCAEALALRKGFPRQLAGLYAKEELDQAGATGNGYSVEAPAPQGAAPSAALPAEVAGPSVPNGGDSGILKIVRVDMSPTSKAHLQKYTITLSTGEVLTTIKGQLGALCEQLCQDGDEVVIGPEDRKTTKWGTDLVNIRRATTELVIQRNEECAGCGLPTARCLCNVPF